MIEFSRRWNLHDIQCQATLLNYQFFKRGQGSFDSKKQFVKVGLFLPLTKYFKPLTEAYYFNVIIHDQGKDQGVAFFLITTCSFSLSKSFL
jgi:hypothetical protein